jgi:AraC-like DNA-binding protein
MILSGKIQGKNLTFEKVPVLENSSFAMEVVTGKEIVCNYHYHPELEFTLVISGSGKVLIGTQWYTFTSGHLALIGSNVPHLYAFIPDNQGCNQTNVIKLSSNFIHGPVEYIPEFSEIKELLKKAQSGIIFPYDKDFKHLFEEIFNSQSFEQFFLVCKLLDKLTKLKYETILSVNHLEEEIQNIPNVKAIENAISFMQKNYKKKITLQDTANAAGMEVESFRKFFKKTIRMSFTDYLLELRLVVACKLLNESKLNIIEIAEMSGFNNLANFNRIFKSKKGLSPKEYRNS